MACSLLLRYFSTSDQFANSAVAGSPVRFIASGNIIFDAPGGSAAQLEKKIAAHLEAALGYPVATFLRTPAELAAVVAYEAFAPAAVAAAHSLHVMFVAAPISAAAAQKLAALSDAVNQFHAHGRELYWLRQAGQDVSPFSGAQLEKALGAAGTIVTLTTDNGAGNDNVFSGTVWDDDANPAGQVPYTTNNGLVTDQGEPAAGDGSAELVGDGCEHNGNWFVDCRKSSCVC